jgi:V8-like Glu-specific endopeptidase
LRDEKEAEMPETTAEKPLPGKSWARALSRRPARRAPSDLLLTVQEFALPPEYRKGARVRIDKRHGGVQVAVKTRVVGRHFFPPDIKTVAVPRRGRAALAAYTEGIIPSHLAISPSPAKLPRELRVRSPFPTLPRGKRRKDLSDPSGIFGTDNRYVFSDTSFPWCTCGKVETEAGWGSGVMIGPRHLMTASHVIVWKPNNTAGWVKFTPLKFDSSEPFGHAFAVRTYFWNKADGSDGLNLTEGAFDYVVCVLDSPIGNITGWMGSRGYDTSWDKGDYWGHIGYPQDISGGTRPAFIGWQSFITEQSAPLGGRSSLRIQHEIDVIPGQSGGPFFGVWSGEPWPRVVGIQSGQNLGGPGGDNTCGGGNPLSELINFARTDMP